MKTKKYISLSLLAGLFYLVSSCYDLDVFPQDQLGPDNFWKTQRDIDMGLAGVYAKMKGGYMDWNRYWLEGITDNGYCQHESQQTFLNMQSGFLEATTAGPVSGVFSGCYTGIAACHNFLKNFPQAKENVVLSETDANRYEAEVRFLRAMCYFELVQRYGDIPLYKEAIESVEASKIKQSPASEIYDFINQDLDYAITWLPDIAYGSGHAVKASAQALQARVALFREDWDTVLNATEGIISSGKYNLSETYESIFIKNEGQLNNPEIIFTINYLNPDYRHEAEREFYYWAALSPTQDLMDEYDMEKDKRAAAWYIYAGVGEKQWINPFGELVETEQTTKTGWILLKHMDKNNPAIYTYSAYDFRTDNDIVVFRLADIYLMYAEAMVEKNGGVTEDEKALTYINLIKKRAGLPELTSITREELRSERRRELAFEGFRHFDLIRWKTAKEVMSNLVTPAGNCRFDDRFYIWPFPQSEMDINFELDQKTGY